MDQKTRDEIRDRLIEISAANGGVLTPEAVVRDAKDPDSPLHGQFDWNVETAAAKYWLIQARNIIRTVHVSVVEERLTAPAWVRDPNAEPDQQGYVSLVRLRSDKDSARSVVVQEFSRAAAAIRRAREVAAFLSLEEVADELIDRIESVKETVSGQAQLAQ